MNWHLSLASQLLKELKKVRFDFENQTLFFDQNGDFVTGYDVIQWEVDGNHRRYQKIGKYTVLGKRVKLTVQNATWISTGNTTVKTSQSSQRYRYPAPSGARGPGSGWVLCPPFYRGKKGRRWKELSMGRIENLA